MPVQIFSPGQVLTAAELTTLVSMQLYPTSATASLNPCVAGNMYYCSGGGALVMTLPTPGTVGQVLGFKLRATTGSVQINRNSTEVIYGPGFNGVTSITINQPEAGVVLVSDGTNWQVVGVFGQIDTYKMAAHQVGAQSIPSATATLVALDTSDWDTNGNFSVSTHLYTCPVAGIYVPIGQYKYSNTGFTSYLTVSIYKNGVVVASVPVTMSSSATGPGGVLPTRLKCAAGDTLGLYAFSSQAASQPLDVSATYWNALSIHYEGPT